MERRREYWFIIGQLVVGGAQRQLTVLASALRARGYEVRVDVLGASSGPFHDELLRAGVDVHLRSAAGVGRLRYLRRWLSAARRRCPAAIHAYLPMQNVLVAVLRPLLRPTKVVWGVRVAAMDLSHYNSVGRLAYRLEGRLGSVPDLTIVNSDTGRRELLERGHPGTRLEVINNGVETARFCPDERRRDEQRRRWQVESDTQLIGIVGRLDPAKDHPTFLRAMATLDTERPRRFICVGGGSPERLAELTALAEQVGIGDRTAFVGDVDDMPAAYNALDALCLSSQHEALPNCLLEAMATALPCAVTAVGDVPLVVGGLVAPVAVGDHEALAAAVLDAVEDPDLGTRMRERVLERYSDERMVDETERVLEDLVNRASR